ncbi:MAG TPA: S41 family peptidase [Candidatus Elarobacter sp.]|jgi:C-terminal processing protease CtpA/Prc
MKRASFVVSSAAVLGVSAIPLRGACAGERLATDAMRADLRAFAATVDEVGVEPYRTSSRDAFRASLARAEHACSEPSPSSVFYVALAQLAASLNDGHVSVAGWTDRSRHGEQGGGEFPLRCIVDADDALVVDADFGDAPAVPRGTVVTSIDGVPAAKVVDLATSLYGGQTRALRRYAARVLDAVFLLAGPHALSQPYRVGITPPGGNERTVTLASVAAPVRAARAAALARGTAPYADLGTTNGVARIAYNSCVDAERFAAFLQGAVTKAKASGARALAVDIRANGGGDSNVNEELFAYVSTKPHRQFGGMTVRASERLRREYGRDKYVKIYGPEAWAARDGEIIRYGPPAPSVPKTAADRFTGPAFLLSGVGTFSSAMACASTAKAFGLMTLVGEETGEPVLSTGEVYEFSLPRTAYKAAVTTKLFPPPLDSLPPDRGVIPDIPAPVTRADRVAGRDPAFEAVVRAVNGGQPSTKMSSRSGVPGETA